MGVPGPADLLTDILESVSRSFYLTLKMLPAAVRPQIGLAYLLARTSDTIADTELIAVEQRLEALERFRGAILSERVPCPSFENLAKAQALPGERIILERAAKSVALLRSQKPDDKARIGAVLDVITSGQQLDIKRFREASRENVLALRTGAELDDYTYRVAGCVGEFWTEMTTAHCLGRWKAPGDFREKGIRFGKGLQLVNILRDLPRDLAQGRCYLPADELGAAGLAPADLLDVKNEARAKVVVDRWRAECEGHLEAGWEYTCALPRGAARLRIACAVPLLIAVKTLRLLKQRSFLDPAQRLKVLRSEVKSIIVRSIALYPFRRKWEGLFRSV